MVAISINSIITPNSRIIIDMPNRYMLDRMQGQEFTFTYYDDGTKTITAYVGKCSYKQHNLTLHASEGGLYEDFKINVIEM